MSALTIYFFIGYFRKRKSTRSTIQEIRERQVGPIGDETHQLRPAELATMPLVPQNQPPMADNVEVKIDPAAATSQKPLTVQENPPPAGEQE